MNDNLIIKYLVLFYLNQNVSSKGRWQ
jgi:hypothetical protein